MRRRKGLSKTMDQKTMIKWLGKRFPVGKRFQYLDKHMIVTGHSVKKGTYDRSGGTWRPAIVAEYLDDNGIIRQKVFSYCDFDLLERMSPFDFKNIGKVKLK